jgi:predicted Zn-dependent protease
MGPLPKWIAAPLMLAAVFLAGCQSASMMAELDPARPPTETPAPADPLSRIGKLLAPPDTSLASQQTMGDGLAKRALARVKLSDDKAFETYLTGMANRIAAGKNPSGLKYRVYLVEDKSANAFTPGGGHIFVTTGLLSRLASEGQMAMVLGHEIAHNAEAHIIKGAHRRAVGQRAAAASKGWFHDRLGLPWISQKVGLAINTSVNLYTRDQEDQADEYGLDYLIAAGYDPREATQTFDSLMIDQDQSRASLFDTSGIQSAKERRIRRLDNLLLAKYPGRDFSKAVGSTATYDRLVTPYLAPAVAAAPPN